ncbi:response regulator [Salinibaculum salinum]|uniref:hybrid sensor histidine kinase/response regulator n=1 Tax=Salinibaculum salinum TaxID=3131996 RepID=UPI0030EE20F8
MSELSVDAIRVLHVDDDPGFTDVTATFLENTDDRFTVETAANANEGLEYLTHDIDCVVSDYDMPGRDGIEFLEAVRDQYPRLPFILFTGKGSEVVASEAISADVTDYLQKQTGTDQYQLLANRIANSVESYRSRQQLRERRADLETSHERISFALESTDSYIYEVDLGTGTETRYGAFERLFGLKSVDVPTSESFYDRAIHPDDRQRVEDIQDLDTLRSLTESIEYEFRTHPDNGDVRWLRSEAYIQSGSDGEPQTLVGLATDITERKQRQRELNRYEKIVENTEDGIYVFDDEARFSFVNQRVVDVSGIPKNAWIGEHVSILSALDTLSEEDVSAIETGIETILQGNEAGVRIELTPDVPYDLDILELRLASFRTTDGSRRVIGYSRDITDLKTREWKLKQLQHQTRSLMTTRTLEETAQVAVDAAQEVLDAELSGFHRLTDDGERLELVTDADAMTAVFETVPEYDRTVESDTVGSVVWDAFESGEIRVIDDTNESERLAGNTPSGSAIIYPIESQGVFIVSATEVDAFDETDKSLTEILSATLTTALQRVNRETLLREREQKLAHQNERLDEFASIVSHDLRNPLSVAQGRLELVRDKCSSEQLATVEKAHERMDTLIEDMLALAREEATATDIEAIGLDEVVSQSWNTVETDEATLAIETESTIRADENRLQRLLENVIRNSVEHGTRSSRTRSDNRVEHGSTGNRTRSVDNVEHGNGDVTVTVGELDDGFYIADDGVGIPADQRDAVFDRGYSTGEGGTGFGLYIVERVVETHGWEITVTESADGGARFEITDVAFVE